MIFAFLGPVGVTAAIFEADVAKQLILDGRTAKHLPETIRREISASTDFAGILEFVRHHRGIAVRSRERAMH